MPDGGERDVIITGSICLSGAISMSDVTRILSHIQAGDPAAARAVVAVGLRRATDVGGGEDG